MKPKITIELWDDHDYVIVIDGVGITGQTVSKSDGIIIKRWLDTAVELWDRVK